MVCSSLPSLLVLGILWAESVMVINIYLYKENDFSVIIFRSLSELEGVKLGGDTSDKIRQVTERATLFRITSNAMINVRYLTAGF